jgi:hypothetical protein
MAKEFAYDLDGINLDCMMVEDVAEFIEHITTLRDYVALKHRAMILRAAGKIDLAAKLEDGCDVLYAMLPSNWRW